MLPFYLSTEEVLDASCSEECLRKLFTPARYESFFVLSRCAVCCEMYGWCTILMKQSVMKETIKGF